MRFTYFTLAVLMFASATPAEPDEVRYMKEAPVAKRALIIGVEAYDKAPKVVNATNDAVGVAKNLKELGFETTLITGSKTQRGALIDAISKHVQSVGRDEISVIFFAGHGIEYGGSNFLVPSDAKNTDILRITTDNIPVPLILRMIGGRRAGLSLIMLDACRTSPFHILDENGRELSRSSGLAAMEAPVSTMIAFAAAPGRTAYSGTEDQGDSYYSRALLRNIRSPSITLETMFKRTRLEVLTATNQKQQPWETTSLLGDLFLKPSAVDLVEQKQAWVTLLNSEPTIELVSRYIALYPGSPWTKSARLWLDDHPTVIPPSGAFADADTDSPVMGALVSPTLSFVPATGWAGDVRSKAVATAALDVVKAKDPGSQIIGTLQTGDFVSLLSAPDAQGWAKIVSEQFGEGFVKGVKVDTDRARKTGRNAREIGEVALDGTSFDPANQLAAHVSSAWIDLLKRSSGKGSPSPVVEISRAASEQDVTEGRSRQLAFTRYLQARASLLRAGADKKYIEGEVSMATMGPGEKSIKVRALEST